MGEVKKFGVKIYLSHILTSVGKTKREAYLMYLIRANEQNVEMCRM